MPENFQRAIPRFITLVLIHSHGKTLVAGCLGGRGNNRSTRCAYSYVSPLREFELLLTGREKGTVLLLTSTTQEPLGLDELPEKRTRKGDIILNPQPDDSPNDPLNWASWRRDIALLCLGWHCLVGGGQTPVLAAGFNDVATTFDVSIPDVALTTGKSRFPLFIYFAIGSLAMLPTSNNRHNSNP